MFQADSLVQSTVSHQDLLLIRLRRLLRLQTIMNSSHKGVLPDIAELRKYFKLRVKNKISIKYRMKKIITNLRFSRKMAITYPLQKMKKID